MSPAETVVRSRTTGKVASHPSGVREERFHQLPHVVSVRAGDAVVLMDQKRGKYFTLNEVGGRVWELIGVGAKGSEIVERLLNEYEVGEEQLKADITTTLRQLVSDQLIARGPEPTPAPLPEKPLTKAAGQTLMNSRELRVPSVLKCGRMILMVKVMLKVRGLTGTMDWARRRLQGIPVRADGDPRLARVTEHQVATAGALYPGRAKCLEQSIVLYYILRREGIAVQFRMGVQPFPFLAHAWVEYRDQPINDVLEHVKWFAPLPTEAP